MALKGYQEKVNQGANRPSTPGLVFQEKKLGAAVGPACPKCGGQMVLRTSWGTSIGTSFWGCSRYPRCCSTITTS